MRSASQSLLRCLRSEAREVQRRLSALRRQQHRIVGVPDLPVPAEGSANLFESALRASVTQHDEVVKRRLADKSRALTEALERVREGTYGICQACKCRIPRRRLEAMPMATLCVTCQEQREVAHAA